MAFKRSGVRIPLAPPQKYHTFCMVFFVYFQGDCANLEKFVPRRCRANPCGLITNEERRKRVAFADIECSFIANKSDTKCPRKAQCNARFVERRRSETWTSSLSSLLRKRASRFLRIPLAPPIGTHPHRWRFDRYGWGFFYNLSVQQSLSSIKNVSNA